VARDISNNSRVLFGSGTGSFPQGVTLAGGAQTSDVGVADFNDDGAPDFAVTSRTGNTVTVLINNGAGAFANTVYNVGANPETIAFGDLDENGAIDIVVGNLGVANTSFLFGAGDGSFSATVAQLTGANDIDVVDFNADGDLDIIRTATSGGVYISFGDGSGTFGGSGSASVTLPASTLSETVIADFNLDGHLDFAVAMAGLDLVRIALGDGGDFPALTPPRNVGAQAESIIVVDIDNDGRLDFVTSDFGTFFTSVVRGNGHGGFTERTNGVGGTGPRGLDSGLVNGDAYPDVAVAGYTSNTVRVGAGAANGQVINLLADIAVGTNPVGVVLVDLDNDGNLDVVSANRGSNNISVALGLGGGSFAISVPHAGGLRPFGIAAGDLDDDGNADVVVCNEDSADVSVFLGDGTGALSVAVPYAVGNKPRTVVIADLDGDLIADLATANWQDDTITVLQGNGDGTFGASSIFDVGVQPWTIVAADLDGDGSIDLATANEIGDSVSVLLQLP
jgi:hypothetical protein